jgi:hypothetical protein
VVPVTLPTLIFKDHDLSENTPEIPTKEENGNHMSPVIPMVQKNENLQTKW